LVSLDSAYWLFRLNHVAIRRIFGNECATQTPQQTALEENNHPKPLPHNFDTALGSNIFTPKTKKPSELLGDDDCILAASGGISYPARTDADPENCEEKVECREQGGVTGGVLSSPQQELLRLSSMLSEDALNDLIKIARRWCEGFSDTAEKTLSRLDQNICM
jgi:hypothetical protein